MKRLLLIFLLILLAGNSPLLAETHTLKISPDQRHIVFEDGHPFFWLGDTAWELFHRTTREEADLYLENRADKGFTVIQAVVLAEQDGLNTPSSPGYTPLQDNDPEKPVEAYFQHVDYIVKKAEELGLFIGMLPTWGDKFNKRWGEGPEIFTPENAYVYGKFLGNRYKNRNIIWILGGDRTCDNDNHLAIVRSMAEGIISGSGGNQLITYHPMGGYSSSNWFHNDKWLDLNMFQSGHGQLNNKNYGMLQKDYQLEPAKPCLDGEPNYEDHPINWKAENGWFDEFESRRAGYWSMLQGACGHTYGNHNIWQMWTQEREPVSQARTPWKQALDHPGAFQAGYMRELFESRSWQLLQPASYLLKGGPNTAGRECRAAIAANASFMMVYSPYGSKFSVSTEKMETKTLKAWWFDTSTGKSISLGTIEKDSLMTFDPPADESRGNDWVLVLDAGNTEFGRPGE